jgi:hypothetical protein
VFGVVHIAARGSLTFVLPTSCRASFAEALLEFRVGNPADAKQAGYVWWSASALAAPYGWRVRQK